MPAGSPIFTVVCGIFSCGMWDPVPWPGIKTKQPALGVWRLNHWTTRKSASLHLKTGSPLYQFCAFGILFIMIYLLICFPINYEHFEGRDHLICLCPPVFSPVYDTQWALSKCMQHESGLNGPLHVLFFPLHRFLISPTDFSQTWKYIPSWCSQRFPRDFWDVNTEKCLNSCSS